MNTINLNCVLGLSYLFIYNDEGKKARRKRREITVQ